MSRTSQQTKKSNFFKKPKNGWRAAFLILLAIILSCSLFIWVRVTSNREPNYVPTQQTTSKVGNPSFQVNLTKKQVNELIDYYLNDYQKKSGISYSFYLEDQALLKGTFEVLGHDIGFYLYFDPYVMENGDIQLKAKSLSIGTLALPMSQIMRYIANNYNLPKWVEVNAKEQNLTIHLSQLKLKSGLVVKASKINLVDNEIRFNVYLPIKK